MRVLTLILLTLSPLTSAQDIAPAVSPSSLFTGDYLLQVVGSFVVVILLLVAVLVMLKRFNGVAPGNVRTLHVFDEPAIEASEQSAPSFADVWKVATGKAETSS
jgi:hypothetical protein